MEIIGKRGRFVVGLGTLADKTDENRVKISKNLSPEERMNVVAEMSLFDLKVKGVDVDARRLDRSVRVVSRKRG